MSTTADGVEVFDDADALYGPGKAANAGGVAVSALEMQQNAARQSWTAEDVAKRLDTIMEDIHNQCTEASMTYVGRPDDYVTGSNAAGFVRVADAMIAQGVI